MKKLLILLMLSACLLCGCGSSVQLYREPVTFYYLMEEYEYGGSASVIASEEREAAGHRDDLSYLLALYLVGPSVEGLRSPIPRGTRIFYVDENEDRVLLKLSNPPSAISDAEFSQACACLTLTCLDLTEAKEVTITCGTRSVTMNREDLILYDGSYLAAMEDNK